jgi:hypothetical protein
VSLATGSLVKKIEGRCRRLGVESGGSVPARQPLEVGLVVELRPPKGAATSIGWTVLWSDGSIYAEYECDLTVVE